MFGAHEPIRRTVVRWVSDQWIMTPDLFKGRAFIHPAAEPATEVLWNIRQGHLVYVCMLRFHGNWGVECVTFRNNERCISYRFPTKELALNWAALERAHIEEDWQ
jgi:hypothetical protein